MPLNLNRAFIACWLSIIVVPPAVSASDRFALTFLPANTHIEFTIGDVLHTVHGTFQLKRGQIDLNLTTGDIAGEIVVDAASGSSGSGARDGRMKRNILEAQRYPEIRFEPSGITGKLPASGSSDVQISGLFTIHGAAHQITIPAQIQCSGNEWVITGKFVVPYVAWGMKNPSTLFLRVNDKVAIAIRTVVKNVAGGAA